PVNRWRRYAVDSLGRWHQSMLERPPAASATVTIASRRARACQAGPPHCQGALVNPRTLTGLILALLSAAAFGTSGARAKGLLVAGWSPAAAVTWRVVVGAIGL